MVEFINAPQLINLVKYNKILYDKSMRSPKNSAVKEKVWMEIARKLNVSVDSVKHRWKTLRDKYVREHKLKNSAWRYYHNLSFLSNPSIKESNILQDYENSQMEYTTELMKAEQLPYEVEVEYESEDNLSDTQDVAPSPRPVYMNSSEKEKPLSTEIHHKRVPKNGQAISSCVDISSVIKAATEHFKETSPVQAFFQSVALQVDEFGLPFSFISRLQIKIIQDLQDIVTEYESTKL